LGYKVHGEHECAEADCGHDPVDGWTGGPS
jgi:hypothetical protein